MPQSLSRVLLHLVFSTKNRLPLIEDPCRDETFSYLAGALNAIGCPAILVGGMPDHVHMLFVMSRTMAISKIVEEVKKESSKWAKRKIHPDFFWQNGYGVFSVSPSMGGEVERYIANQKQHHQTRTFQDELRLLFKIHGIEWDERYVWD